MPSYAPEWARFSPGNVLMAHLISHCIETGLTTLDLMRGDDAYKQSFSNSQISLVDYSLYVSRLGKAIEPIFVACGSEIAPPPSASPATTIQSF